MKAITVNLADFAGLVGKTRATLQTWVRAGLPVQRPRGGRRGAHQIALGPAIRWVLERMEAAAEERIAAVTARSPAAEAARTRKVVAEARIAEANAAEREGQLVAVAGAEQRYARLIGAGRERLLILPGVLVQRDLVAADREAEVVALVHEALAELAARGTSA
jgi:phage terminase Nu1 subunit (DNA packaging protein)